jgi:hypothetical protein
MGVTATNLIQGAGTLYYGTFGATEPADTAVNATPPSSSWTDLGGTDGGVKFSIDQKFSQLTCDQLIDDVGSRLTSRSVTFETNLAEPTLANLSLSINGGTSASGAGFASLDALNTTAASQPNYYATIMDGFAPSPANAVFRRRVVLRKTINTSKVESAYTKDKQTFIPVSFKSHYVSPTVTPFRWVDQTS